MDDFVLILVLYLFSPRHGRIDSAAVREASWAGIVGKVMLYVGQYDGAGGA